MKRIKIYKDGAVYTTGFGFDIIPNGVEPEEEFEADNLTLEEIEKIRINPKDIQIRKKMKRIK